MSAPIVQIDYDPEANVWYVEASDLPGLGAEAPTVDALIARLPAITADYATGRVPIPMVTVIV